MPERVFANVASIAHARVGAVASDLRDATSLERWESSTTWNQPEMETKDRRRESWATKARSKQ